MRVALRALAANRLRSGLTMLGIIIGVGAVITMIAVGAGAQARVEDQIKGLGSNLIIIMSGSVTSGGARMGSGSSFTISEDDAQVLMREIPALISAPAGRGGVQVVAGNATWAHAMFGVAP